MGPGASEEAVEQPADEGLTVERRWRLITLGLLRAAVTAALMVLLYYTLPLDRRAHSHLVLALVVGIVALVATVTWQVRAIVRAAHPGIRATQALATIVPLFLLVFASSYFIFGYQDPATFSEPLSRTDALYFTVTIFATVGFGDITPESQTVRLIVSAQMLLDLVVLGLGIQVILGAVKRARDS
jgi:voltage-gated potassium channel